MRRYEQRRVIFDFPRYEVSNFGKVYNILTGRQMVLSPTEYGILSVGLMRDHGDGYVYQHRRSVKRLVAEAFVRGQTENFNTPIQLDGDKTNLRASNLMWRPRWFAWMYAHQFEDMKDWFFSGPIIEIRSRRQYATILDAAMSNGNLCKDIQYSLLNENLLVFPGGEEYIYKPK